ncbi:nucleophosmin-like [Phodopus roborovskii]|uniref:nucleophosmin-like n=1 Tax=Phodopus roborovskii TaxID=109678 RepID=UPI0021E3E14E|nr:nucleophosmin-like [Phodopus roborovskii]
MVERFSMEVGGSVQRRQSGQLEAWTKAQWTALESPVSTPQAAKAILAIASLPNELKAESMIESCQTLATLQNYNAKGVKGGVPSLKTKQAFEDDEEDEDDDDDEFDDEETEEKVPVKKSVRDTPAKNAQKSNQNGKDLKPSTPRSKGQESFKKQEKTPKTPKGPSSVEDIKAKMQASIEKGGSLPKVETKFINYVKNCFRMTDQEAIQDLWNQILCEGP